MATNDFKVISLGGCATAPAMVFRTEASATAINAGEPLLVGGTGTNYAVHPADAKILISEANFIGASATVGTHTSTADGTVAITMALPGMVWACKALLASTINTDAKLLAVLNDNVYIDLTSSTFTIDVANSSAGGTGALRIVGGDIVNGIVYFTTHTAGTYFA